MSQEEKKANPVTPPEAAGADGDAEGPGASKHRAMRGGVPEARLGRPRAALTELLQLRGHGLGAQREGRGWGSLGRRGCWRGRQERLRHETPHLGCKAARPTPPSGPARREAGCQKPSVFCLKG